MLVAREKLRLVEEGGKLGTTRVRVNVDLCRVFPHRSLDSIKQGSYIKTSQRSRVSDQRVQEQTRKESGPPRS